MAFFEEEDEEQVGQQVAGPEGTATLGGGGESSGNAAAAAEPAAPAGGGGGNFVGIKQYLDANKPQSEKLAGKVGGYVGELSQTVRDTLPGQQQKFNEAVDQNTVGLDEGLVNEAKTNIAGVAGDAGKKAQFQKMRDAEYKGPQAFETSEFYKPAEDALKKAQAAGENTQTEQGQRTLINQLQQDKTGKTGGAGVTSFDQMLLQGSQTGKQKMTEAREGQKDLGGLFEQAKTAGLEKAKQASEKSAATRAAIQGEFGAQGASGQKPIESSLAQRAAEQIGLSGQQTSRLESALSSGLPLSDQDLRLLGISRTNYEDLQNAMGQLTLSAQGDTTAGVGSFADIPQSMGGVNLGQFLAKANPSNFINAQNVATGDEYAKYAALNDLMGSGGTFLNDPNQAGKATTDAADLNFKAAQDYLNNLLAQQNKVTEWRAPAPDEQNTSWWHSTFGNANPF